MTKEEMQELREMMSEVVDEKLQPVNERLDRMENDISYLKADVAEIKNDVAELKESLEEVRVTTNAQSAWIEKNFDYLPYPIELENELDDEAKEALERHRALIRKHNEEKVVLI